MAPDLSPDWRTAHQPSARRWLCCDARAAGRGRTNAAAASRRPSTDKEPISTPFVPHGAWAATITAKARELGLDVVAEGAERSLRGRSCCATAVVRARATSTRSRCFLRRSRGCCANEPSSRLHKPKRRRLRPWRPGRPVPAAKHAGTARACASARPAP